MLNFNLRVTSDSLEIITTLNKMYHDQSPVLVWQNLGERRIIRNAVISAIDFAAGKVILVPNDPHKSFDFVGPHTVYMRGQEKSILFKRESVRIDKKRILVDIPKEVRMFEKRISHRIKLGFNSPYLGIIEIKINSSSDLRKEFSFNIYDLSAKGLSFNFNFKDQIFFAEGTEIYISKLGQIPFKIPIEGRVVYLKKIEFMSSGARISKMKMGVAFKKAIAEKILQSFR
ncbi:MAG: hypothetical protein A2X86_13210 [Bdellovibrionales bacterium GWA2_49_15]|nr:MAG: hypothetical protein A2X86_13210 [Bdellovibrionales bacterium GWA2_49_15]HAZ13483.1 hypothetical protein [Bdellovibrionales bacterium]